MWVFCWLVYVHLLRVKNKILGVTVVCESQWAQQHVAADAQTVRILSMRRSPGMKKKDPSN